jgi:crotonobetainyl-CoA:carnitine CoA-transferase CaiB-like acyl-CoA transferase
MTRGITFDRTPGPDPFAAPVFGQHTDAVLARSGYSAEEIEQLHASGAIPERRDS